MSAVSSKKYKLPLISFEVTSRCNLKCVYCYNPWRRESKPQIRYSSGRIKKTLKRIHKVFDFDGISFTGGEPFLEKSLPELVLYSRMRGKSATIISNGTQASFEQYRMCNNLGSVLFELPLLSFSAETHDRITQVRGSFDKVTASVKALKEMKAEIVSVFVVTRENADDFGKTAKLAAEIGINNLMLARYNIGGRAVRNYKDISASYDQLKEVFREAEETAAKRKMNITSNVCTPFCILKPSDFPHIRMGSCGSTPEKRPITVDAAGDVRMCNHSPVKMGNIFKDNVFDIFNSEYAREWETVVPDFCSNCDQWKNCKGGCRAASEQLGKSLKNEDPVIRLLRPDKYC